MLYSFSTPVRVDVCYQNRGTCETTATQQQQQQQQQQKGTANVEDF